LHERKFLALNGGAVFNIITSWIQNIEIVVSIIPDRELGLGLAPHVRAHQIGVEYLNVHRCTNQKSENEKIDRRYVAEQLHRLQGLLLPLYFTRLLIISIRTMPAPAHAAMSALEVIFFSEHDITLLAHVKIFRIEFWIVEGLCHGKRI
jgi:hypothetical protein